MEQYINSVAYLNILGEVGENLSCLVDDVLDLYKNGMYKSVPNAARMFYEYFIDDYLYKDSIPPQHENSKTEENTNYGYALSLYFTKTHKNNNNINFYKQVLKDIFKDTNSYSHYRKVSEVDIRTLIDDCDKIISNLFEVCEWIYYNETLRDRPSNYPSFDIEKLHESAKSGRNSDETEVRMLRTQIKDAQNEIKDLEKQIDDYNNKQSVFVADETKEQLEKLERKLSNKDKKIELLQNTINNLKIDTNESNDKHTATIKNLYEKINDLTDKNNGLTEQNIHLLKQNNHYKQVSANYRVKNELIKDKAIEKINEYEDLIDDLKTKINKLQNVQIANNSKTNANIKIHDDNFTKLKNIICQSIDFMNSQKCYVTFSTLLKFLKGEESNQTKYFPMLTENNMFGCVKKVDVSYFDSALNSLINEKKIIKDGFKYKLSS